MEFVKHAPIIENGARRIAVRIPQPDGSGFEDFIDIPLADLDGKSDDDVAEMILAGAAALEAKYAAPTRDKPEADDVVARALTRIKAAKKDAP